MKKHELRHYTVVLLGMILLFSGSALSKTAIPQNAGPHIMPIVDPGARAQSAPSNAHLNYYGGKVVSNMEVVQVLWGEGSYIPEVTSSVSPSIATFYNAVLNSSYVDWLAEYDTNVQDFAGNPGTNQHIGHGVFVGQVIITPSANATTVDDSVIQDELVKQIAAGNLPLPSRDSSGHNNTYYAVYFPSGITITESNSSSCQEFCAYHGTVVAGRGIGEFYYGVHPDFQAGSGCDLGCGDSSNTFDNLTSVASHEMVETLTDPEVGIATADAPPLGWYDDTNGEIGDICNAQQGGLIGSDGVSYTVQQEYSNRAKDCIVTF